MTEDELLALVQHHESDQVELTIATKDTDKFAQAICAFANDLLISETILREKMVADYPEVALRELLMNAVLHRDYDSTAPIRFYWFDDRIEIQNPGSLYGEASKENFPSQNTYRNPIIAEAMKILGYVNKFGRGVYRAQAALKGNANPPAEFNFADSYVLVTLRKRQ